MVGQLQGDERSRAVLGQLDAFANEHGHSVLELAFSWLLAQPVGQLGHSGRDDGGAGRGQRSCLRMGADAGRARRGGRDRRLGRHQRGDRAFRHGRERSGNPRTIARGGWGWLGCGGRLAGLWLGSFDSAVAFD